MNDDHHNPANDVARIPAGAITTIEDAKRGIATLMDAEQALGNAFVAEAAETVWERAKDSTKLYAAIQIKLLNQAAYVVWRQDVAKAGRPGKLSQNGDNLPALDPGASVTHRWRKRLCAWVVEVKRWQIDDAKLAAALADAGKRCVRIVEQEKMGTIRGTEGTGEFERYTPPKYIEAAREVMGGIDLDPASCDMAQQTVQAADYFTAENSGLVQDWHGRVWMNPPYHRDLQPQFINKLVGELNAGRVTEAIVLTNNSTDTEWFRTAADACATICFTEGRIRFTVPDDDTVLPTQGQAFFYFGGNVEKFVEVFSDADVGWCVSRNRRAVVPADLLQAQDQRGREALGDEVTGRQDA